ncbi:MAG: AzlD domain-containing protein [Clostridia bacterium]|nr:AzlD domain-containing protein [Clostridia bacterium]MBO5416016.1 AzlD domain-containing protein [Clostridia bacterium]
MNYILLALCMMVVTYGVRLLPSFITDKIKISPKAEKFLNLIPFTALGALIFPGVLSVDASRWYVGAVGALAAIVLSCIKRMPTAVTVIVSVLVTMLFFL